jgi:aryl-alcohol dehydrogenase-like predicted oxidoreductase
MNSFTQFVKDYWLTTSRGRIPYGMGCAWLGRSSDYQKNLRLDLQTLETAYQLGFRYFDTAPVYGRSECVLGDFVPSVPRCCIFLATKVELAEVTDPQQVTTFVWESLTQSLKRLKTDTIDLYQIHDIREPSNVFRAGGALEVLLDAQRQGLIRYIGMAVRDHFILRTAAEHESFDTILTYADYTPLNRTAADLIQFTNAAGKGVINANPLSHMLAKMSPEQLCQYERYPFYAVMKKITEDYDEFAALCKSVNVSMLQAALHFPLTNPAIDITLTGPATPQEVQSSIQALNSPVEGSLYEEWKQRNGS